MLLLNLILRVEVCLLNSTGVIIDQVQYPQQYRNAPTEEFRMQPMSGCIFPNTPGTTNDNKSGQSTLHCPQLETQGGFYSQSSIRVRFVARKQEKPFITLIMEMNLQEHRNYTTPIPGY